MSISPLTLPAVRTEFPRSVTTLDKVWIPMEDGVNLAATVWLPADAEDSPVPALLEFLPYRKDDNHAAQDSRRQPYQAGFGYAVARVDMRGSGNSDGILEDEYLPQEQLDAVAIIQWLSEQSWCTGSVGMFGISWSGFNCLQVAARRPAALKAVISLCSSDDRYGTDVHYNGGCVMADMMPGWAHAMLVRNSQPPDPAVVGDRWREMWFDRLENSPPFIEEWMSHQTRDDYWKQGSVGEDYSSIECAVFAVGGWADSYSDTVMRLIQGLSSPRLGLIGPWGHRFPQEAYPGPRIGFLQECVRWWDYWLKEIDTGIMEEPLLRAYLQRRPIPEPGTSEVPGRWVAEDEWPSHNSELLRLSLGQDGLGLEGEPLEIVIPTNLLVGSDAGRWGVSMHRDEQPQDQRFEDALSRCFTSEPLTQTVEILGTPRVRLRLAVDQQEAMVAVRLCDVSPDGTSLLVTRGLLNLTHRDGHEAPEPLVPGEYFNVDIDLNSIGYSFEPGHRMRLSISPSYWPWAWPSPSLANVQLETGETSYLDLPCRKESGDQDVRFGRPETHAEIPQITLERKPRERLIERDIVSGKVRLIEDIGDSRTLLPSQGGIEIGRSGRDVFTIVDGEPQTATSDCFLSWSVGRGEWQTRTDARTVMTAGVSSFEISCILDAYEGDARVFTKNWSFSIPRNHV